MKWLDARILVLVTLASCGKSDQPRAAAPDVAPRQVQVEEARPRPMERTLQVVGTLAAHDEAVVAAQVAGQIEKAYVDIGDRTRAGQKIALIDTAAYQVAMKQSAAALARANARAENVKRNLERVRQLQQDRVIPAIELDQAVADEAAARAEVQQAQAGAALARLNLERSQVKSPFDGAVAERLAGVGDYVAVGAPIARVVQTDPLRLRMQVSERDSPAVRPGQTVRVTVEGDPQSHPGRIARIAPAIREADRILVVEADVPNEGSLRAGLFARAQIVIADSDLGLAVPARALVTFAGLEKVVTIKDGKATEKTVTTGRRGDDWIEIVAGLKSGEQVALAPAGLRTGQPVRATSAASATASGGGGAKL
jgi:RND family efflux transporter MFP subunit